MSDKDQQGTLILVAILAGVLGIVFAGLFIHGPKQGSVTTVEAIPSSFPDVHNNSTYSSFMHPGAIDPTQAVPVGSSQNSSPFSGAQ